MDFSEYQERAMTTAQYDNDDQAFMCAITGLQGELGELMEVLKKYKRGDDEKAGMSDIAAFKKFKANSIMEAGDVLWYLSLYLYLLDIDMDRVALLNLNKLRKRAEADAIQGSGDWR